MPRHNSQWDDARGAATGLFFRALGPADECEAPGGLAALGFARRTSAIGREALAMKPRPRKPSGVGKPKRLSVREILRAAYRKCAHDKFTRQALASLR